MHSKLFIGLGSLILLRLLYALFSALASPLRSVPGPFWARFTKFWFFQRVARGNFEKDNIELHRRYGRIVRVAPDMYSIDTPDLVNQIYGIGSKMPKAKWYEGFKHPKPGYWNLFQDWDIKRHSENRRRFQALYSMSSVVGYEKYIDDCADIFRQRMSEFAKGGKTIDMFHWFQCYAFDVIGDITYSKRFGFLNGGDDISGLLKAINSSVIYSALIGIYYSLHPFVYAMMNMLGVGGATGRAYLMKFVGQQVEQRKKERDKFAETSVSLDEKTPQDFLDKLIIQNEDNPGKVTAYHVFTMGMANVMAGSDTTAISLSAILHNLMRNPEAMKKLREEIEERISDGRFDGKHLSFKESTQMPYLQAVIKEALRMHAATGLPLWRVVTDGGMEFDGRFFSEGNIIGLNTWVAHYNEDVFGNDAKQFRPERWIEAEKIGGQKLARMTAYYLPFGLGSRTCIGRHISYLEMSKLVPLIVREFDFEAVKGDCEWKLRNYWFVKPTNFRVNIKFR